MQTKYKNMKNFNLILFGLFISTALLNAQADFRSGYIIKDTGDTLYGTIDYRMDSYMSNICRFKNSDNIISVYSPSDIIAFRFIDSKFYVVREINSQKLFLEYLIKGKVNIYFLKNDRDEHYFIDKEGEKIMEIPFKESFVTIDRREYYSESTKHIGVLKYYMKDAPGLKSEIEGLKNLQQNNLIKLAKDYQNIVCKDEQCIVFENKIPVIKFSLEPCVGLISYRGDNKNIFSYGGYVFVSNPQVSEKLYFKTGIIFNTSKWYSTEAEELVDVKIVKFPLQFQYMYTAKKLQPKASIGVIFWTYNSDEDSGSAHSLSTSVGINYKFSNTLSLSTNFDLEYNPLIGGIVYDGGGLDLISYSIYLGLNITL
jgi:hypothetical protein